MRLGEAVSYRIKTLRRFLKQPRKLLRLATSRAGLRAVRYAVLPPKHGSLHTGAEGVGVRQYGSYDEYVKHQKSKLGMVDLTDYDPTFRADFARRLAELGEWRGKSVLCLAARIGTEVRAFHDVGAFAVGTDLEPGTDNRWVLPGDFHEPVFPDASADALYCNSLDHALDLERLLKEAHRVAKPGGTFLVDAQYGVDDDTATVVEDFDDWAATSWASIDVLVERVRGAGFELVSRTAITVPQPGQQLVFTAS